MKKTFVLLYGIINYALGSAALVSLIAFIFNLIPENAYLPSIDTQTSTGTSTSAGIAMLINIGLISLFALQHSVMARPGFKSVIKRYIPEAAERSTYMLMTAIVAFVLIVFWQPVTDVLWQAETTSLSYTLLAIGLSGWALVFYATFLINHFDLFGLRQVWLYFTGKPYTQLPFKLTALYRIIRHPIMTGVFIGIWFTPVMTIGHLLFATAMSVYIMIGVYHEEKDLINAFGKHYREYMRNTGKFIPLLGKSAKTSEHIAQAH